MKKINIKNTEYVSVIFFAINAFVHYPFSELEGSANRKKQIKFYRKLDK